MKSFLRELREYRLNSEKRRHRLMQITGLSLHTIKVAEDLSISISKNTAMAPSETWIPVEQFLIALMKGYKIRKTHGIDTMDHLLNIAAYGPNGSEID